MVKHYYYYSTIEDAKEFMRSTPIDKQEDIKVCFPVDTDYSIKSSTESVSESLKQLIKGSDEPLTEERIKEIIAEVNDLINIWPQIRVL